MSIKKYSLSPNISIYKDTEEENEELFNQKEKEEEKEECVHFEGLIL